MSASRSARCSRNSTRRCATPTPDDAHATISRLRSIAGHWSPRWPSPAHPTRSRLAALPARSRVRGPPPRSSCHWSPSGAGWAVTLNHVGGESSTGGDELQACRLSPSDSRAASHTRMPCRQDTVAPLVKPSRASSFAPAPPTRRAGRQIGVSKRRITLGPYQPSAPVRPTSPPPFRNDGRSGLFLPSVQAAKHRLASVRRSRAWG